MESKLRIRIIELLRQYPVLRDAPDKLVLSIWMQDVPNFQKQLTMHEFFTGAYGGKFKLTPTATIHRTRREIQSSMPELEGKRIERLGKAERVRKEIHETEYNLIV